MDVKEIITHLENFKNTWEGWSKFLGGLVKFFGEGGKDGLGFITNFKAWTEAGDNLKGLSEK